MERLKTLFSSVDNFKRAIELQGINDVFSDIKKDLSLLEERMGYGIADKMCELQHDQTWSMQALANVLLMCKGDKTSYHPAILLGCYDKDLEGMNEAVYEAVLGMQKHIKELEDEIKIMQETKRTSNT